MYRHPNVYDYLMSRPNAVNRVNSMVQSMERPFIDLTAKPRTAGQAFIRFNHFHAVSGVC